MTKYSHVKNVLEFFGVDLRSNDVTRQRGFASDGTQNVYHWASGSVGQRPGTKNRQRLQVLQSAKYEATDILGVSKSEIVLVGHDGVVYALRKGTFTITNGHATDAVTTSLYYDSGSSLYRIVFTRGGATILSTTLGNGTGTGEVSLSSLRTTINAAGASLTMSDPANDGGSDYGSYLDNIKDESITANGGTITLDYYYLHTIHKDAASTTVLDMRNVAYELGEETFEGVPTALVRGCLYLSPVTLRAKALAGGTTSAATAMLKYDGQAIYRAGLPQPPYATYGYSGSMTLTDTKGSRARTAALTGVYDYRLQFKQVDKVANIVESDVGEINSAGTGAGPDVILVDFASSPALISKGYNTRFAVFSAAAGPALTFNVDNGAGSDHTLQIGDIGYFWDENQDRFIQREVTARTGTTITFSTTSLDSDPTSINYDAGGNVTVNDNGVISANLRIVVWRSRTIAATGTPSPLYLCEELPYWQGLGSLLCDEKTDADLGAELVEPQYARREPPVGRYLCAFNDQLIVTGIEGRPTTVAYSDIDSPEYFTPDLTEFDVAAPTTGCRQTGAVLAVGTTDGIQVASGDLANFNFRVEKVVGSLGVLSHAAMFEVDEGILHVLTKRGPYVLRNGRDFQPLGGKVYEDNAKVSRIEPYFTTQYQSSVEQPYFKRAVGCVVPGDNLIILFVPHELPTRKGFATSNSRTWVFDYGRNAWWPWTGLNMGAGVLANDDGIFFAERATSGAATYTAIATGGIKKFQRKAGAYNYDDQGSAMTWRLRSWWEALGRQDFFKRFIRLRIGVTESRPAASSAMSFKTYVDFDSSLLSTSDTLTLAAEKSIKVKVKGEVCRSMQFVFEGTAIHQPIPIDGLTIEGVASFREVIKE